jgi:hypothetical protein
VGVCVGGNHCVGVGGSVSVGSLGSGVGVADGNSVEGIVDVGVGTLVCGLSANIEMPMQ